MRAFFSTVRFCMQMKLKGSYHLKETGCNKNCRNYKEIIFIIILRAIYYLSAIENGDSSTNVN